MPLIRIIPEGIGASGNINELVEKNGALQYLWHPVLLNGAAACLLLRKNGYGVPSRRFLNSTFTGSRAGFEV